MRILVVSDNHGIESNLKTALSSQIYDYLIHLGDSEFSNQQLEKINAIAVKGNCDYANLELNKIVEFAKYRLYLTHGHMHFIRENKDMIKAVKAGENDLVLNGHLHQFFVQKVDKTIYLSPGSIEYPRGQDNFPTFAIIQLLPKQILVEKYQISNNNCKLLEVFEF